MNYLIDVNPPTRFSSLETGGGYRGSWGAGDAYLNDEHSRIHAETESLPGPRHRHDAEKLYEMAFHSGAVILEIGTDGGRSATVALRGALAGLAMSAQARLPQLYGIDRNPAAIIRSRETLNTQELSAFALLFPGTLAQFRRAIPITPTMVFITGAHEYASVWAYLQNLTEMLAKGTPVLCCDYAVPCVARAVNEWLASGHYKAAGKFGDSALLMATDLCGRGARGEIKRPMALPQKTFNEVRQSLLNEPLHAEDASACGVLTQRVAEATAPARLAALHAHQVSDTYVARGWPYEKQETKKLPASLPDGRPWPKISIVTPSYNYGRFIEETILSVLNQDYPNLEYIVMDGGSTDETVAVMDRYRQSLTVAVSEPDKGQSNAINKGFAKATGDIFAWVNADDMLAPGALHAMAMAFWHSGADVVAGICEQYRDDRLIEKHMTCCPNGPLPLDELLDVEGSWMTGEFFMQPEVMFTRAIWEKAGGSVKEDLFYSMDYELWLRFALAGAKLHVIGRSICHFRHHGDQKTALQEKFIPELMRVRDTFAAENKIVPANQRVAGNPRHQLRIASVSDVGFKLGAGIGQRRIATALAAAGHDVYSFAATDAGMSQEVAGVGKIVDAVAAVSPDVVLIGNVHGARLPPDLLAECARHWATGVVLHDLWALTGRCAYNGTCTKYLTGCDETCPTADEYPALPPQEILPHWQAKYAIYQGPQPPVLLANSEWTAAFARNALAARSNAAAAGATTSPVFPIRYGVELDEFRPLPRRFCRQELDLPQDRFLILASASSLEDPRKGITLLAEAVRNLSLPDVTVVCLGRPDDALQAALPGVRALGYIHDPRRLAMVYSAVDLFVGPSREEAFGQVFTEAAACGTPSIGFPVGGIPEAIADGVTGYVAATASAEALASAIYELYQQPERRRAMAVWGRIFAENEWSPQMAYHGLHVALRKSGIAARLNFPPKIHFVPHPPTLPAAINLALHGGEWQPISGFEAWEGPYPDKGLPRCRWLVGPVSRFRVSATRPGPHQLHIKCTTFHPNAVLRVVHKGQTVKDIAVPVFVRGKPACEFTCALHLDENSGPIEIIHWPWSVEDSARGFSILLFEMKVIGPADNELVSAESVVAADHPSDRK